MTKFISLFAGPGGMCTGAKNLGIETVGIEWDADACKTRRAAGLPTVEGDVRTYGPSDFPDCDSLMGGPPCQTFTVAGNGSGRKSLDDVVQLIRWMAAGEDVTDVLSTVADDRTALVVEPLRWILQAASSGNPYRNIVLEQVPTVLPVWKEYASVLDTLGYKVVTGVLNAEQYGVPQTRKRAFLVASLDRLPVLPKPTHSKYRKGVARSQVDAGCLPWVALEDVADRGAPYWVRSNYNTASTGQRGRRDSNTPSFTVTSCVLRNRLFTHAGVELPRLSFAEAGAVQSFPVDYPWSGKGVHQQIGNAAPPLLVAAVLSAALSDG